MILREAIIYRPFQFHFSSVKEKQLKIQYLCTMNLITGGTGFLGAHVAALLLKQGQSVKILKRTDSSLDELRLIFRYHFGAESEQYIKKLSFAEGDITSTPDLVMALKNIRNVYHCAATVSFDRKDQKLLKFVNVIGTENLVNILLEQKHAVRLCHVSSIASLGRKSNNGLIDESVLWEDSGQNTAYSRTKYLAEIEVWRGIAEGLNAFIVQPGILLGPGLWDKGSCKLFKQVDRGLRFYTKGINGFVNVEDTAEIMIKLMQTNISEQRFILVSQNLSYQELFGMMAKAFNKNLPSIHAGYALRKIVVFADALSSIIFQKNRNYSDEFAVIAGSKSEYISAKIKSTLNYQFSDIHQCIQKTCRFYNQTISE